MNPPNLASEIWIKAFQWEDWRALWRLRNAQLAEQGIHSDTVPDCPDFKSPYERDFHRIESTYLSRRGNFWIAWMTDQPVGHIGSQDNGDFLKLRGMYVRNEYRCQGIGTRLVGT